MAVYKFDGFVFDSSTYRLTHGGQRVALRPKAAKLLNFLIQNRERVVAKSEIMSEVWQSTYARDHLLFQLISELRKPPLKAEFVRTEPNMGYQWNVRTAVVRVVFPRPFQPESRLASTALAISLVAAVAVSLTIVLVTPNTSSISDITRAESVRLPAHNAFSKGVVALEQDDNERAAEWFKFALTEDPESIVSTLFLAETLLKQDKTEESSMHLEALLQKPSLDAYNKMTATDLMSHVRQRQGKLQEALRYAQQSGRAKIVAQCSVEAVERRIETLESELGIPLAVSNDVSNADSSSTDSDTNNPPRYKDQCSQLSIDFIETSYCVPDNIDSFYVSANKIKARDIS